MCGFVGYAGPEIFDGADMRGGVASIDHRGPDAAGIRLLEGSGSRAAFGAVRLRIIDLSPEGDQPMDNEDGSVWVAFNGELYNHAELRSQLQAAGHTFRSKTDTEVLVHGYEEHAGAPEVFLERLRGMFAIAVFDSRRGRLLLARDRLGIKPLYWTELAGGGVGFGSEIRALAKARFVSAQPDVDAVRGYLLRGVVPGPQTMFAGVSELGPGELLEWSGSGLERRTWWRPHLEPVGRSPEEAQDVLREALRDSVARHLISDRPIGVFLSSGADSGAIATIAADIGTIRTFTVTFPDEHTDEGDAAASLARHIGADHERVPVTTDSVGEWIGDALSDMDQPTHDGINSWLVCRAARSAGLVVALSGLGGDELFGGYQTFRLVPKVAKIRWALGVAPTGLRAAAARWAGVRTPGGRATRVLAAGPGVVGAYRATRGLFSPAEIVGGSPWLDGVPPGADPRDAVTLLETTQYMRDQLLRDTDQMSMAHSLEVRVPLLDDEVVRVALSLPASVRTEPGKALLVRASGLQQVHAKRPFTLPFDRWLLGPLQGMVREGLLSEALPFADTVPRELRRRLWETLATGRVHWSRPWAVTVLRLWPRANGLDW
ncbi:MAG: asparagine synthase (glutamine-hydrolyzing) [Actinomycetota bacterium]